MFVEILYSYAEKHILERGPFTLVVVFSDSAKLCFQLICGFMGEVILDFFPVEEGVLEGAFSEDFESIDLFLCPLFYWLLHS